MCILSWSQVDQFAIIFKMNFKQHLLIIFVCNTSVFSAYLWKMTNFIDTLALKTSIKKGKVSDLSRG